MVADDFAAVFVCVYRQHVPTAAEWDQTASRAASDDKLRTFLAQYWSPNRYFDWGDDPSFFCAQATFGDPSRASWAVCRPDVRDAVRAGDVVVYFVQKPKTIKKRRGWQRTGSAEYFYVGCGTVSRRVSRHELWTDASLEPYTRFYNALARPTASGGLTNVEVFPMHEDWARRAAAPVILFDPSATLFNLEQPHHVARCDPDAGVPEQWRSDPVSRRLEQMLFAGVDRRLRTSRTGFQHAKRVLRMPRSMMLALRHELLEIAGFGP